MQAGHAPETGTSSDLDIAAVLGNDYLNGWNVLLWNDDVHSMDYVVLVLMRVLGLDTPTAVDIMFEAHHSGKAVAWSGPKETGELHREHLEEFGLTATLSR